jgi:NitT/TauT family transport system permease protein
MTSSALAFPASGIGAWRQHPLVVRYAPIVTVVLALIAIWYVAAVLMNLALVRRF